jgi:acyl dehydratase
LAEKTRESIRFADLPNLAEKQLGVSDWIQIDQDRINQFADATGDHQWIHMDPERARSGPFGGPIAHGYLTLSLASALLFEILAVDDADQVVNYGLGKVRFPAPVPVDSRIRLSVECTSVEEVRGGYQLTLASSFEVEGKDKPACVAEILIRYYGAEK